MRLDVRSPGARGATSHSGTLKLLDPSFAMLWELALGQQLFALGSADLNGDGKDEIVTCSWDGLTYIIDADRNAVIFDFSDPVCAFCTGTVTLRWAPVGWRARRSGPTEQRSALTMRAI